MRTEALTPIAASPGSAGLFMDFDGTLSDIVDIPSEARPHADVRGLLSDLVARYRLVSIVSGRSATELVEWLGSEVEIWGVHGAQRAIGGRVSYAERVLPHRELIAAVIKEAEQEVSVAKLPGVVVEDKGVMIGLHFRAAEDRDKARAQLDRIADDLARKHGLLRAAGRLVYELRPPVEFSKATVVLERAREEHLTAALFVGDDRVDLPAFDALDILSKEGVQTVRVAVASTETPPELLQRADVVVEGPSGVVRLLTELVAD